MAGSVGLDNDGGGLIVLIPGDMEFEAKAPLTSRSLLRSVEHDHVKLAKLKDGRHTLRLSPLTAALKSQALNWTKDLGEGLSVA